MMLGQWVALTAIREQQVAQVNSNTIMHAVVRPANAVALTAASREVVSGGVTAAGCLPSDFIPMHG
jgi:hypothetical protein